MLDLLAVKDGIERLNVPRVWMNGAFVQFAHEELITDGALFQCLDCGRWSDSLNVLNAVDCEEVEGKTLEELRA